MSGSLRETCKIVSELPQSPLATLWSNLYLHGPVPVANRTLSRQECCGSESRVLCGPYGGIVVSLVRGSGISSRGDV